MAIEAPRLVTELPGPKAKALIERDEAVVSPSYTRAYPLVVARGHGAVVEDVDGNRFLDFSSGIAVTSTGHCHPEVVAAIQQQAERLLHMSGTDFYYTPQIELAERIAAVAPVRKPALTFFSNSGAESVEAAIKLARRKTGRPYLLAFHGAFHGRTLGALSLTASKPIQRYGFGPLVGSVVHAPYADPYRPAFGGDSVACAADCLRYIEETLLHTSLPPEELAAIIVEPVQGESGYIVPPAEFIQGLRDLCDRHGSLLIADEVQSGMGRTGKLFAVEHFDVEPDIVCVAKGVASGLPLGVTVAPIDLMDWPSGSHASTFGGNPVSCAAALATLRLVEEELAANAAEVGSFMIERLRLLQERHTSIGDVRGLGLMIGVDLVRDPQTRDGDTGLRDALIRDCFERGLLVLPAGNSVLRFVPPLVISRHEAETALAIFGECLESRA